MFFASIILLYVVFVLSYLVMYAAFRVESKFLLYLVSFIYLAVGLLLSFFLLLDNTRPSELVNIGLGFCILVTLLVSLIGIIAGGIILFIRKIGRRRSAS